MYHTPQCPTTCGMSSSTCSATSQCNPSTHNTARPPACTSPPPPPAGRAERAVPAAGGVPHCGGRHAAGRHRAGGRGGHPQPHPPRPQQPPGGAAQQRGRARHRGWRQQQQPRGHGGGHHGGCHGRPGPVRGAELLGVVEEVLVLKWGGFVMGQGTPLWVVSSGGAGWFMGGVVPATCSVARCSADFVY
jgi:hypothetical protein